MSRCSGPGGWGVGAEHGARLTRAGIGGGYVAGDTHHEEIRMSDEPQAEGTQGTDGGGEGGKLSGPGAGLSATGRTADQFGPGDAPAGGDYNDPGGIDTAPEQEESDAGS